MIAVDEYVGTDMQNMAPILFRGKDCFYWQQKMFARNEVVYLYGNNNCAKGVDFLVLFNPSTFLKITPGGIDELIDRWHVIFKEKEQQGSVKEPFFSLTGHPFLAMRTKSYERLKSDLAHLDLFSSFADAGIEVVDIHLESPYETLDRRKDFLSIESFILHFQAEQLLENNVIIEDYHRFYLEGMIPIGAGTRIASGVVIKGECKIGKNTILYPHVYIENSLIGDNCVILPGCIINSSTLENNVQVGPYTHLRMGALVKEGAKMGNFVEMKKSTLGKGSKAMHLSYIGDADIGEKVNIGAGTITCNYDGVNKNKTVIEDNVFIGSGTELVAPVTVKKNSYVAAGSTITEEVPVGSLGVARQRQRNIIDWVKRKRNKT